MHFGAESTISFIKDAGIHFSAVQIEGGRLIDYWNQIADKASRYDDEWYLRGIIGGRTWFNYFYSTVIERIISDNLPLLKLENIIDIGCGLGRWSTFLAFRFNGYVVGVDASEKMVCLAKKRAEILGFSNIDFHNMNIFKLGFKDNSFDLAFTVTVLQHLIDTKIWRNGIKEICRVTKSGGEIVILETAPDMSLATGLSRGDIVFRPESMYLKEFYLNRAKFMKKVNVNNILAAFLIKFSHLFLKDKLVSPKINFYDSYAPRRLYLPSMLLTKLVTVIDRIPVPYGFGWTKMLIFKKV